MKTANTVMLGDCIGLMRGLAAGSVDFVLTDPPYIVALSWPRRSPRQERRQRPLAPSSLRGNVSRPERRILLRQLLWLEQDRSLHGRLARGGISHCGPYRLSQTLCFIRPIHALRARASLSCWRRAIRLRLCDRSRM